MKAGGVLPRANATLIRRTPMKTLIALFALSLLPLTAFSQTTAQNPEFAARAKEAAKAIYDLNWGPSLSDQFEIRKEKYEEDDAHAYGTCQFQVFTIEKGKKYDRGIDLNVKVIDNAVTEVKVNCRLCS
jgi:hypothetical protein